MQQKIKTYLGGRKMKLWKKLAFTGVSALMVGTLAACGSGSKDRPMQVTQPRYKCIKLGTNQIILIN